MFFIINFFTPRPLRLRVQKNILPGNGKISRQGNLSILKNGAKKEIFRLSPSSSLFAKRKGQGAKQLIQLTLCAMRQTLCAFPWPPEVLKLYNSFLSIFFFCGIESLG
jgi:hypothetical protein